MAISKEAEMPKWTGLSGSNSDKKRKEIKLFELKSILLHYKSAVDT